MKRFQPLFVLILLILSSFNIQTGKPLLVKWVINKGCSLKVDGSTNINKFSCIITSNAPSDTLIFEKIKASESIKVDGCLKLNVQQFDCHNPVMTSDLRKTLKSKEFPELIIKFISLSRFPNHEFGDFIKGVITIELAGVVKRFDIKYRVMQLSGNRLKLIGARHLNFSDFNIIPPRKLGGMIKTDDELKVEFNLIVKVLENA